MSLLRRPQFRIGLAFWLFGLINNVLYVIILSAAVDLVPSTVPKSIVLFADAAPAFFAKLAGPYFIHLIPYGARMCILVAMSTFSMLAVASGDSITIRLIAIGVASAASGWGEMSFLALTHYFPVGRIALAGFSSGTGASGLVGAGCYALVTTTFGFTSRTTLYWSSFLPLIIIFCYFVTLPRPQSADQYQSVAQSDQPDSVDGVDEPNERSDLAETLEASMTATAPSLLDTPMTGMRATVARIQKLLYPYMLPLFIVYAAEYVAISGVAPTILFPIAESPFKNLRDFYPAYNAVYQVGVFISRSSILFFRLQNIYTPSILQIINLGLLTLQALFYVVPTVWLVFVAYFWVGLLGGAVYANTFAKVTDEVGAADREFSLGAVGVADSFGIILASIIAMPLEPAICNYQAAHGRGWCKRV